MLRRTAVAAGLGLAAAASALLFGVDRDDVVRDALLVFLAGLVSLAAARIALSALPGPRAVVRHARARRPPASLIPESLARAESVVALAQADQLEFHFRLRPLLQDVAAVGYAAMAGAPGGELSPAAAEAFSPATWALIRPDRPRPEGPGDHGVPSGALSAALDELESILPP